jgi:hypothetical protein
MIVCAKSLHDCQLTYRRLGRARGKLDLRGYVAIQDVVEVAGVAAAYSIIGIKYIHELTMGDHEGPPMGVSILRDSCVLLWPREARSTLLWR